MRFYLNNIYLFYCNIIYFIIKDNQYFSFIIWWNFAVALHLGLTEMLVSGWTRTLFLLRLSILFTVGRGLSSDLLLEPASTSTREDTIWESFWGQDISLGLEIEWYSIAPLHCPYFIAKRYYFSKTLHNIQKGLDLFMDLINTISPTFIIFSHLLW